MKKILIIAPYYEPAFKFGGPIRSIKNLINALDSNYEFYVVTRDRDFGDSTAFDSVSVGSWINVSDNVNLFYVDSKVSFFKQVNQIKELGHFYVVYLNSFFDFNFSIRFQLLLLFKKINCDRVIIAPRGELSYGAMNIKSFKKRMFIFFYNLLNVHRGAIFHFTDPYELNEAKNYLGNVSSFVVPNMHEKIPDFVFKEKVKGELVVGFLSRISVKKNLITIVNSLMHVPDVKVTLKIAGFKEDLEYWSEVQQKVNLLPSNVRVEYVGALNRAEIPIFFKSIHVFMLPTFNENYGHSIVEAMVHSNIVVISDKTPWNEVSSFGGFVGNPLDVDFFSCVLKEVADYDTVQFNEHSKMTYDFCKNKLDENQALVSKTFMF